VIYNRRQAGYLAAAAALQRPRLAKAMHVTRKKSRPLLQESCIQKSTLAFSTIFSFTERFWKQLKEQEKQFKNSLKKQLCNYL
jgi:hypothetical protein